MQVEIKIGSETVTVRGNEDGTADLCHWVDMKHGDEITPTLIPFKFYASLYSCLQRVLEMKVNRKHIFSLNELITEIKAERDWLRKEFKL